jgi:hypothetical protein
LLAFLGIGASSQNGMFVKLQMLIFITFPNLLLVQIWMHIPETLLAATLRGPLVKLLLAFFICPFGRIALDQVAQHILGIHACTQCANPSTPRQ